MHPQLTSHTPSCKINLLVVSVSEIWAKSVRTILSSLQEFNLLDTAKGGLTAYEVIRERQPELLIIDDSLPSDEVLRLLKLLDDCVERPYSIVMVPSVRHEWFVRRAGADATVLRTHTSDQLIDAVHSARDHLLSQR